MSIGWLVEAVSQFEKCEFEKNAFEVLFYDNFLLTIFFNLISNLI